MIIQLNISLFVGENKKCLELPFPMRAGYLQLCDMSTSLQPNPYLVIGDFVSGRGFGELR